MFDFDFRIYALLLGCALLIGTAVYFIRRWIVRRARVGRTGGFRVSGIVLGIVGAAAILFSGYVYYDCLQDVRQQFWIFRVIAEATLAPVIFFDLVLFLLGLAAIISGCFFVRHSRAVSGDSLT